MLYVDKIRKEIETVTPEELSGHEPQAEMTENETLRGIAGDELKKLWVLICRQEKEKEQLIEEKRPNMQSTLEDVQHLIEGLAKNSSHIEDRKKVLIDLFWISVKDTYGLWSSEYAIGVRKGWKIVTYKRPQNSGPGGMGGMQILGPFPFPFPFPPNMF